MPTTSIPARRANEPLAAYWTLACWITTGRDPARTATLLGVPTARIHRLAATWSWRSRVAQATTSSDQVRATGSDNGHSRPSLSADPELTSTNTTSDPHADPLGYSATLEGMQLPISNRVWLSVWWPLAWISDLCDRSAATRTGYIHDVAAYADWLDLDQGRDILTTTRADMSTYRDALLSGAATSTRRSASPATVRRRFAALRRVFDWLDAAELMAGNPAESIRLPRVDAAAVMLRRPWITADQRVRVLDAIDDHTRAGRVSRRDRALVYVLAYVGPRVGELERMTVGSLTDAGLSWAGKGARVRAVTLAPEVRDAIEQYLEGRRAAAPYWRLPKTAPLFATASGSPVGARQVRKILGRVCALAGVPYMSPHAWRHGLITAARRAGVPREDVQRWVGHARADTTALYEHLPPHHGTDAGVTVWETDRQAS